MGRIEREVSKLDFVIFQSNDLTYGTDREAKVSHPSQILALDVGRCQGTIHETQETEISKRKQWFIRNACFFDHFFSLWTTQAMSRVCGNPLEIANKAVSID